MLDGWWRRSSQQDDSGIAIGTDRPRGGRSLPQTGHFTGTAHSGVQSVWPWAFDPFVVMSQQCAAPHTVRGMDDKPPSTIPDPLTFAQQWLGCRCAEVEPESGRGPCLQEQRLADIINARDAQIRADECEATATEWLTTEPARSTYAHVRFFAEALRERATQHRGAQP